MWKIIAVLAAINGQGVKTDHVSRQEIYCLARVVYSEARGETLQGNVAVAHVVLNRMKAPPFPKTVCDVVYQPAQFTDVQHSKPDFDSVAWDRAVTEAAFAYMGLSEDPTHGSKWFYAQHKVNPHWAKSYQLAAVINNHTFLTEVNK